MPRSIATKISLAALSLTTIIVLALGAASYLFSRHTLREQIEEKLAFEAAMLGHRLETRLNTINADLQSLSTNLVVVNALIDSAGREMYVEPLLRSYRLPNQIPCKLTLCDFAGQPIISCQGGEALRPYTDQALLTQLITRQQPLARLEKNGQESTLLIAHPVFYAATGKAEGMLVLELPFAAVVANALSLRPANEDNFLILSNRAGELWTTAKERPTRMLRTTIPLKTAPPLARLALTLTVGEDAGKAYGSLTIMTAIYLAIGAGALLLAVALSRAMGRKLTAPLTALTTTANQVARNDNPDAPITIASHDEITQLAASFNTMLARLKESHDSLEQRVAERTTELVAVNEKLRTEVHERTLAEGKAREYAAMQKVLLQEVNHRVKNNLVAIISMLHQEEDRASDQGLGEYHSRLQEVTWRVSGLLTVHRLLSSSEWKPLPLDTLCDNVIRETCKILAAPRPAQVTVAPSPVRVNSDQAHYLAMILNELTTNTMKYARHGQEAAEITVAIAQQDETIHLTYRDNGPGYPEPILQGLFDKSGIGFHLIFGLVTKSLRGTITLANDNGAVARIAFPAEAPDQIP